METFNLPPEAAEFLSMGRQFDYNPSQCEAGVVKLKTLRQLELGEVWIHTNIVGDPHFKEDGYYAVPAVSLTGECKAYDPEFILLWLPQEMRFGTWDCDHWVLTLFPLASWEDIVANPATYLNAQWEANCAVGEQMKPWAKYPLRKGHPF